MQAERHWHITRLQALANDWVTFPRSRSASDYGKGYRDACAACASALDKLIAERTK